MKAKIFIIASLSYAILGIALRKVVKDEFDWQGVISAIVQGIIFSTLIVTLGFKLMEKLGRQLANSVPAVKLAKDERLLLESPANHMKGLVGVGGKLFLTDKRLVFKSHKFDVNNDQQELPLNQIDAVTQGEGKFEMVLQVTFANNEMERFVVKSPIRWVEMLERQLSMP